MESVFLFIKTYFTIGMIQWQIHFKRVVICNTSVKIFILIATVDNKCLYPNYKLLSQYILRMHRNEISWLKPNKIKFWAEYRTQFFKFFPPCRPSLQFLQLNKKITKQQLKKYLLNTFFKHSTRHSTNKAQFLDPLLESGMYFFFLLQINVALLSRRNLF